MKAVEEAGIAQAAGPDTCGPGFDGGALEALLEAAMSSRGDGQSHDRFLLAKAASASGLVASLEVNRCVN